MYILDTDTLTHLHAGHPRVIQHLREVDDPAVGITIITKIEMLLGRFDFVLKAATATLQSSPAHFCRLTKFSPKAMMSAYA